MSASELFAYQQTEIAKNDLHQIVNLESEVTYAIVEMQHHGVAVDVEAAEETMVDLAAKIEVGQAKINEMAGFEVNPNPSGSIKRVFQPKQNEQGDWFTSCGTSLDATGAGNPSINADALKRIKNPIAKHILEIRQLKKLKDTFIRGHVLNSHIRASKIRLHHWAKGQLVEEAPGIPLENTDRSRL